MNKLLATVYKELLLLRRDRAGLLVLFAMPAVLVPALVSTDNIAGEWMVTGPVKIVPLLGRTSAPLLMIVPPV